MADTPSSDFLRIPKWILPFLIPLILLIAVFVRMEDRTAANRKEIESIRASAQQYKTERAQHDREVEMRFDRVESNIQYLCDARARDDRESGKPTTTRDCR